MTVDCGCGLSAEVAAFGVEVERAHAVGAMSAVELHTALDALDSIGFHCLNCSLLPGYSPHSLVGQRR